METDQNLAIAYAQTNTDRFLDDLVNLCAIPSVSSLPAHQGDMQRAAEQVAVLLQAAGLEGVAVLPTRGHPVVYAEWKQAGPGRPTILFYGHYDVQPALDLGAWHSYPFEPQVRGENLYARGASDNKGQFIAAIKAIEAVQRTSGKLPVNVKFLIEGEEEVGSRNLRSFIAAQKASLACDFAFNPDAGMAAPDQPSITYGLRGGVRIDLSVTGPKHDLHSGTFGGTIHNPAQALIELIAGMHDAQGRVTLPGFYDRVRPLEVEERQEMARGPMDEAFFLNETGAAALWGEPEFTPYERTTARPTLEVLSFHAGLAGEGTLNIVPAGASAAISMRLVPDQEPQEVHQAMLRYLETHAPPTIRWQARYIGGGRACLVERHSPQAQALQRALQGTWGVEPIFTRIGGGIPVVGQLQDEMGIPSLLTGFGLPDDNIHGPNEKLHLPTWRKGIEATIRFLYEL
jgi:acetylornithine deacetylase/succinyl-diaminopimelate desuccinylase-like protein